MELKKVQKQGRDEKTQEDYTLHLLCIFADVYGSLLAYRNKAEMKERKKTTLHLLCIFADVFGSLLAFFHLCLVSVLFSAPSLLEIKFQRNFFPSFCSFFGGF